MQLRAATVQHPWAEAKGTLPKVPMLKRPRVLDDRCPYEMNDEKTGMSRVFYLPQLITLSTRHPLALRRIQQAAEFLRMEANFENSWAPHQGLEPRPSTQQAVVLPL